MKIGHRWFRRLNAVRLGVTLLALWKLVRHPATPWPAKAVALATLAYAVSPIDLIPDFVPVLGQLDDLIIVPLGAALVVRLTPPALWQARLLEAEASRERLPRLWWGALIVVAVWLVLLALFAAWLWRMARAA